MKTRVVEAKRKVCRRLLDGAARSAFVALLGLSAASYAQATTQPATQPAVSTLPAHWQELPVDKLTALAQQYQAMADSPAARADRQRLAQQSSPILQKSQSWEPSDRLGSMKLAAVVGSDLTSEQRQPVVELIQNQVLKPEILSKVSADELVELDHAMLGLGEPGPEIATAAADWIGASKQWQTASPQALTEMMGMLQHDQSRQVAMAQIAGGSWTRFLSQEKFINQSPFTTLVPLITASGRLFTPDQHAQLEKQITVRFFDPAALAGMPPEQFSALYPAMLSLGSTKPKIASVARVWVGAGDQWRQSNTEQLLTVMEMFHQDEGAAGALALQKKVGGLIRLRLDSIVSSTEPLELLELVESSGAFLEPQDQRHTASLLMTRLVDDPKVLGALNAETVMHIWYALGKIGVGDQFASVASRWLQIGDHWKSSRPTDLAVLLGTLTNLRAAQPVETLNALFDQKAVDATLSGDDRAQWLLQRASAAEMYPANAAGGEPWLTKALPLAESEPVRLECIRRLALARATLGHLDDAKALIINSGAKLSDDDRQRLAALQPQLEQAAADAQRNPATVQHKTHWVDESEFAALMRQVTQDGTQLSSNDHANIEKKIADQFLQPSVMAAMPPDQFMMLYPAMKTLGWSKAQIASLAVSWIGASDQWKQSASGDLLGLMEMMHQDQTAPGLLTAQGKVADYVAPWLKGSEAASTSPILMFELVESTGPFMQGKQQQEIVKFLTGRFVDDSKTLNALPGESLVNLYVALQQLAQTREQCVVVAARWLHGDQWKSSRPADLAVLLSMLSVPKPVNEAAIVSAFFEEKANDRKLSGDERATWLLARADAAEINAFENEPSGSPWVTRALAVAESETIRIQCVKRLALGNAILGHADVANSLLASLKPQFSEDGRQQLAAIQQQVDKTASDLEKDKLAQDVAGKAAWKQELQHRLDEAKAKNDQEQIARYQSLLAKQ